MKVPTLFKEKKLKKNKKTSHSHFHFVHFLTLTLSFLFFICMYNIEVMLPRVAFSVLFQKHVHLVCMCVFVCMSVFYKETGTETMVT